MNKFELIKERFFYYRNFLKSVLSYVEKREKNNSVIKNSDLAKAANRVAVPKPFLPYVEYCSRSTGFEFSKDLYFTIDEVRKVDESIIHTFSNDPMSLKNINIDFLIKSAIKVSEQLGFSEDYKFEEMSASEAIDSFPKDTSSGFPVFKRKDSDAAIKDATKWSSAFMGNPSLANILSQPTAVFHRFQYKVKKTLNSSNFREIRKKVRPVWGVSFRVLLIEGILLRNLLNFCIDNVLKQSQPVTSYGLTKSGISDKIIYNLRQSKSNIVSIDYEQWDSHVPSILWCLFFSVLSIYIPKKYSEHLKCLLAFYVYTPFCWKSTKLRFQRRGVPSGCMMTSFFNTFANLTVVNYAYQEKSNGKFFAEESACALGDDLVFIAGIIHLKDLLRISDKFGLVIDPRSCQVARFDKEFDFLGYIWDVENRPTQEVEWYIAHLCMPSRFFRNPSIPIDLLQTYRGISVCMGLHKGMDWFEYLVGTFDYVWQVLKRDFESGTDPLITYYGEDSRLFGIRIPLSLIYSEGWRSL